jgi:tetratricopeptide (TPR) repeat protein
LQRQYAEEQLGAAGEIDAAYDAHMNHFAAFMQQLETDLKGRRQLAALGEIEADFENVRAAWQRAIQHKEYAALDRTLESLKLFVEMRGRVQEREQLFGQAQKQLAPQTGEEAHPVWCRTVVRRKGFLGYDEEAKVQVEPCLEAARQLDDRPEVAYCLYALGDASLSLGDISGALSFFEESLAQYRELDDKYYIVLTLNRAGICYGRLGQQDKYFAFSQQSLEVAREIGDTIGTAWASNSMGIATFWAGKYAEAESWLHQTRTIWGEIGNPMGSLSSMITQAHICFLLGDFPKARALAQEGVGLATEINSAYDKAFAVVMLGMVASMEEDYAEGQQISEETRPILATHPWRRYFPDFAAAAALCGLGEYQAAKEHNQAAMKQTTFFGPAAQTWDLPIAAIILAHEGEKERSVEILGLALTHPLSPTGWIEKWPLLTRLRADLEAELGSEVYKAAWERGKALEPDQVVAELLED